MLFILCLAVAAAFAGSETILRGLLISSIATAILFPLLVLLTRRTFDVFEPIAPAAAALFLMFVVRPIVDQVTSNYDHLGFNISGDFEATLLTALVGCTAFSIGYLSNLGTSLHRFFPKPGFEFRRKRAVRAALALSLIGLGVYGIFLHSHGGAAMLFLILKGRSKELGDIQRHSTTYLYGSINFLIPASFTFFAAWLHFRRAYLLTLTAGTVLPILVLGSAQGSRSGLLPLVLGLAAIYYLYVGQRPKAKNLVILAGLLIVLSSFMREFRDSQRTTSRSAVAGQFAKDPGQALAKTFSSSDDEMFDTLANTLSMVPSRIPYHPFGLITDVATRVIPRVLYPNKPLEISDRLIVALWPMHYQYSRASAANSIFGNFYMYGGILGVALGAFGIGMLFNQTWKWYGRNSNNVNAVLLYAFVPGFVVILLRGTVTDTLGRLFFTLLPLVIAQRFWRRKA